MEQHTRELIMIFEGRTSRLSLKYSLAYKKFRMWQAYYEDIVSKANGNPNIISMAFTQKLLAYVGIAESLFSRKLNQDESIRRFFRRLDGESKLLLMFAVQYGRSEDQRRRREQRVLKGIARSNKAVLTKMFNEVIYVEKRKNKLQRGRALLNLRHRLIHYGEFVVTFIRGITNEVLALRSPDFYLAIDERVISLDEIFLRGIGRMARIPLPSLKKRLKRFLINHGWYRFARSGKPLTTVFSSI